MDIYLQKIDTTNEQEVINAHNLSEILIKDMEDYNMDTNKINKMLNLDLVLQDKITRKTNEQNKKREKKLDESLASADEVLASAKKLLDKINETDKLSLFNKEVSDNLEKEITTISMRKEITTKHTKKLKRIK
jgi:hypothetical protein